MAKPTFLCIGAQKAGTTWLSKMLERHPDIWIPPVKELHYFDYVHLNEMKMPEKRLKALKNAVDRKYSGKPISNSYLKYLANLALFDNYDDDYYLSLFDDSDRKVVGEVTPEYSMLTEAGVAHIKSLLDNVKIIFIMRNPMQRAWSFARMFLREQIKSDQIISTRQWMNVISRPGNKKRTDYKKTIELYESFFDKERILYLFYDDICTQPLQVLSKTLTFLEVEYCEDLYSEIVSERHNVNPEVEIPQEIYKLLEKEYKEQEIYVRQRFNPAQFEL